MNQNKNKILTELGIDYSMPEIFGYCDIKEEIGSTENPLLGNYKKKNNFFIYYGIFVILFLILILLIKAL